MDGWMDEWMDGWREGGKDGGKEEGWRGSKKQAIPSIKQEADTHFIMLAGLSTEGL